MADQAALDTAVADVASHVSDLTAADDALRTAAQAVIDKLNALGVAPDFQAEVDQLNAAVQGVSNAKDAAQGVADSLTQAATPPAAPTA